MPHLTLHLILCRVSARFLQHCSLVQLPAISLKGFQLIFTAMLRRHMQVGENGSAVAKGSVYFFKGCH
jgi:hypothetical protein